MEDFPFEASGKVRPISGLGKPPIQMPERHDGRDRHQNAQIVN